MDQTFSPPQANPADAAGAGPADTSSEPVTKRQRADAKGKAHVDPPSGVRSKPVQASPALNWCGTFNNYTAEDYDRVLSTMRESTKRWIVGKEVGEQGTPHLQMYFQLHKKQRATAVFSWTKSIHWEAAKGTPDQNFDYCSKEGDYQHNFPKLPTLRVLKESTFYHWQREALEKLRLPPGDRKVLWIYDEKGCTGKSQFLKFLCAEEQGVLLGGRPGDALFIASEFPASIYCFALAREEAYDAPYSTMEKIKDGLYCNTKYESKMIVRGHPHVIVMANYPPKWEALSRDRWEVYEIVGLTLKPVPAPGGAGGISAHYRAVPPAPVAIPPGPSAVIAAVQEDVLSDLGEEDASDFKVPPDAWFSAMGAV